MVMFLLYIKADLDNVEWLARPDDAQWCLTVKNSVGEDVRENVYVSNDEEHELTGSRGTAHFLLKWERDSRKEAYLNVTHVKKVTRNYTAADSGEWVPIIAFDCRGMEPIAFRPEDNWRIKSKGGKLFEDVDLSDGEWADYDDDAGLSCELLNLEWKFEVTKG